MSRRAKPPAGTARRRTTAKAAAKAKATAKAKASTAKRPAAPAAWDLRAFQARIAAAYGAKDAARGTAGTFMYFIEEVGELSEALREPERHDLPGEFADCLAWLASLAHLAGIDLAAVTDAKYPGVCPDCAATPCRCDSKP